MDFKAHSTSKIKKEYHPPPPAWQRGGGSSSSDGGGGRAAEEEGGGGGKRSKFEGVVDHCSPARAIHINDMITQFVVGCALPFLIVNSVFFIAMVVSLNSAYAKLMPKEAAFRNTLLPKLFASTVIALDAMWLACGNPLRTLGWDGFKGEDGDNVVNVTESALGKTAFKACVDPGDKKEDSTFYGDLLIGQLEEGAAAARKPVEDTYVGVVGDNVQYNQNAVKQVKAKFPKLFGPGCVAHCSDLLMEDLCDGIPEIKDTVKQCRAVAVFVKSHGRVKAAFKRIIGSKGTMLVLYPDTRFGYADKTVERVCKNQENLASLVDGAGWRTLLSNADGQQTTNFLATVNDVLFFQEKQAFAKVDGAALGPRPPPRARRSAHLQRVPALQRAREARGRVGG